MSLQTLFTSRKLLLSLTSAVALVSAPSWAQDNASEKLKATPAINAQGLSAGQKESQGFTPLREQAASEGAEPLPRLSPEGVVPAAPNARIPNGTSARNLMDMPVSSLPSIADLVENVSQSVVNVIVRTESGETTSEGQGSGFIISDKNEVVTNYHVIEGGDSINIEFNDGQIYPARVLGTDEETDLALLQIKTQKDIPHLSFKQEGDVRIGDWVVAIGNPFGIGQSTSLGVISAIGRERVDSGNYVDYIQTDATINRGNSGGPLFNLDGEVVGVNSAIYSPTGASVGIAFVIPHTTADQIVNSLRTDGRVRRGFLGAALRDAEFEIEGRPGIFKAGALVNDVVAGSPAQQYGLQVDDIILRINDKAVRNAVEATRVIGDMKPGDVGRFIYERDEKTYALNISIAERPNKHEVETAKAVTQGLPPPPPKEPARGTINIDTGLQVLDISSEFRNAIKMRSDQVGIYVESVTPGSQAEAAGFETGMVLLEAENEPLAETDVLRSVVLNAKLDEKQSITLNVRLKNGRETYMVLPF